MPEHLGNIPNLLQTPRGSWEATSTVHYGYEQRYDYGCKNQLVSKREPLVVKFIFLCHAL